MTTKVCFKCGKEKVAIRQRDENVEIKMVQMGWGKHRGEFKCKNCAEAS